MACRQADTRGGGGGDPWADFRVLCRYYADCVERAESQSEVFYADRQDIDFIPVRPPPGWLEPLPGVDGSFPACADDFSHLAFRAVVETHKRYDERVYIGYPCKVFSARDRGVGRCIAPIFLIPVEVANGDDGRLRVRPNLRGVKLNEKWLRSFFPQEEYRRIQAFLIAEDGGLNIPAVLSYLTRLTGVNLNPRELGPALEMRDGLQNAAVLGVGMKLVYNRNLRRELLVISNESGEVLDGTALAYVFRKPVKPSPGLDIRGARAPVGFLPLNCRQTEALLDALNRPCTKIQGPPGTGKSYAAVNLLLNLAYAGKSALFTSRNHAAVHAIDDLVAKIVQGEKGDGSDGVGLDLIQFCSSRDDPRGRRNAWHNADLDDMQERAREVAGAIQGNPETLREYMKGCGKRFLKIWEAQGRREDVVMRAERAAYRMDMHRKQCEELRGRAPDKKDAAALRLLAAGGPGTFWGKLFHWLSGRGARIAAAERRLREKYPSVPGGERADFRRNLRGQFRHRFLARGYEARKEKVEAEALALPPYEELFDGLLAVLGEIGEKRIDALRLEVLQRTRNLSDGLKGRLSRLCRQLERADLPFMIGTVAPDIHEAAQEAFREFTRFYPIWVSTILSLPSASPCVAGVFDRVVIDEAGQCDIPPMIPALFRAKGVTVIGDPEQFPPIKNLSPVIHEYLRQMHGLGGQRLASFDYLAETCFSAVPGQATLLTEHRRCSAAIAGYFSDAFYKGRLDVIDTPVAGREDPRIDRFPRCMGYRAALEWEDVRDSAEGEFRAVERILDTILKNRASPDAGARDLVRDVSIGIISPLRGVVETLKTRLAPYYGKFPKNVFDEGAVNTAYAFQGGTKGMVIFVLGLTSALKPGQRWYIDSEENKSIYNVAISRAKFCCIIVGDREQAKRSGLAALRKLAGGPRLRPRGEDRIGPGENVLQDELVRAGLDPVPQYRLLNRRLDLALVESKIDVEVDGEAWHLTERGTRKQDDIFRDYQVSLLGWRPFRVWHREVMNDAAGVARKILRLHLSRLPRDSPRTAS